MKKILKKFNNFHTPSKLYPDVFIFGCARSGTTLMHELITTQASFKPAKVPFDLRYTPIAQYMSKHGINSWADYYDDEATPAIQEYIEGIRSGKINITDPFFYNNSNRLITRRIAFKILHACEDRISWFENQFDSKIVYMLRHPVPVAHSRRQIPRLETFINSNFKNFFTAEQLDFAKKIVSSGNLMQKSVLDWAFQNSVSLRDVGKDWIIVSYEQLVVDPEPVLKKLSKELSLKDTDTLRKRLYNPSYSTKWSDATTNSVLLNLGKADENTRQKYNQWLIHGKWQDKVSKLEAQQLTEILDVFDIDLYSIDSPLPHSRYWIGDQSNATTQTQTDNANQLSKIHA